MASSAASENVEESQKSVLEGLRSEISARPLDGDSFARLAESEELTGSPDRASIYHFRAIQLQQLARQSKPSHGLDRFNALVASSSAGTPVLRVGRWRFPAIRFTESAGYGQWVGTSEDGKAFIKIPVGLDDPVARQAFAREATMLLRLTESGCESSARILERGELNTDQLETVTDLSGSRHFGPSQPYIISSYIRADKGGFGFADIFLSLLEQKAAGIYQNRLALEDIRFDAIAGICRFTHYRNAIQLPDSVRKLDPQGFWEWCLEQEESRPDARTATLLRGFRAEAKRVLQDGRLQLAYTALFSRQRIADIRPSIVQPVELNEAVLSLNEGTEDLAGILDRIPFRASEEVLVAGSGSGLHARYLAERGCSVTGIEFHAELVVGARVLSRIAGLSGRYKQADLDFESVEGAFDTVCLLNSLHHNWSWEQAANRLADCCRSRIIIETGLSERGYKWFGRWFQKTPGWHWNTLEQATESFDSAFKPFSCREPFPSAAPGRYIFVLERKDRS